MIAYGLRRGFARFSGDDGGDGRPRSSSWSIFRLRRRWGLEVPLSLLIRADELIEAGRAGERDSFRRETFATRQDSIWVM